MIQGSGSARRQAGRAARRPPLLPRSPTPQAPPLPACTSWRKQACGRPSSTPYTQRRSAPTNWPRWAERERSTSLVLQAAALCVKERAQRRRWTSAALRHGYIAPCPPVALVVGPSCRAAPLSQQQCDQGWRAAGGSQPSGRRACSETLAPRRRGCGTERSSQARRVQCGENRGPWGSARPPVPALGALGARSASPCLPAEHCGHIKAAARSRNGAACSQEVGGPPPRRRACTLVTTLSCIVSSPCRCAAAMQPLMDDHQAAPGAPQHPTAVGATSADRRPSLQQLLLGQLGRASTGSQEFGLGSLGGSPMHARESTGAGQGQGQGHAWLRLCYSCHASSCAGLISQLSLPPSPCSPAQAWTWASWTAPPGGAPWPGKSAPPPPPPLQHTTWTPPAARPTPAQR